MKNYWTGTADFLTDPETWPQFLKLIGGLGGTKSQEAWDALKALAEKNMMSVGVAGDLTHMTDGVPFLAPDVSSILESVPGLKDIADYVNGLMVSIGDENAANRTFNSDEAAKQREWQSEENAISRQWQTDMSNSAYQRMTADLKAAGLNPILAATNGATSTPSGVVGAGSSASYNVGGGDTFSSILNSIGGIASAISQFLPANKTVQVIKSFAKAAK